MVRVALNRLDLYGPGQMGNALATPNFSDGTKEFDRARFTQVLFLRSISSTIRENSGSLQVNAILFDAFHWL